MYTWSRIVEGLAEAARQAEIAKQDEAAAAAEQHTLPPVPATRLVGSSGRGNSTLFWDDQGKLFGTGEGAQGRLGTGDAERKITAVQVRVRVRVRVRRWI